MESKFKNIARLGLEVRKLALHAREGEGYQGSYFIECVRAADLESLLAKGVRVRQPCDMKVWTAIAHDDDTHTALLIAIEPIKRESAEDVLRAIIEDHERLCRLEGRESNWPLIERAKAVVGNG